MSKQNPRIGTEFARYDLRVVKARKGYANHVGRAGVFNALYDRKWLAWGMRDSYQRLRKLWHWQLGRLRQGGWPCIQQGKDFGYACNCPPFGAICRDAPRYCRRPLVCPFCYARTYLMEPYRALERVLFGTREEPHEPDPKWRLVEFVATRRLSPQNEVWDADNKCLVLKKARHLVRVDRRVEVDYLQPLAGFVHHRMEFFQGFWPLKRSGVLLCKGRTELPKPQHGFRLHDVHKQLTKKLLAQVVARTFSMPKTSFLAEIDDLLLYLDMFEGMRMFSRYGKVRQQTDRRDD